MENQIKSNLMIPIFIKALGIIQFNEGCEWADYVTRKQIAGNIQEYNHINIYYNLRESTYHMNVKSVKNIIIQEFQCSIEVSA